MHTEMSISVVIPVYNEQDNVEPLAREVFAALSGKVPFELIYVDDASTDDTQSALMQLQQQHEVLRVVRHQRNAGQSAAIVSGVKAAQYDWIATLDGDGQNDPADIMKLYAEAKKMMSQYPKLLCAGHRVERHDNGLRLLSSKIANGVRRYCLKDGCPDTGCGIKLFPRSLFLSIPHFRNCHRFLPALFKRAGATMITVPVSHRERVRGTSKYGVMNRLWVGIVDLVGVSWLIRRPVDVECESEFKSL